MKTPMNIIININDKYVMPAVTMLTSLANNHPNQKFTLLVLHSGLACQSISAINQKLVDAFEITFANALENINAVLPQSKYISIEAYLRIFAYRYYDEDVERALYIDSDIIINKNISEFYFQKFEGNLLVACEDPVISKTRVDVYKNLNLGKEEKYFNSGLLLYNIAELKKNEKLTEEICCFIIKHQNSIVFHDQDILNGFFRKKAKIISPEKYNCFVAELYNFSMVESAKENVSVIHYANIWKPWNINYCGYLSEVFWKYAKLAGYRYEYEQFNKKNKAYNIKFNRFKLRMQRYVKSMIRRYFVKRIFKGIHGIY